ncbi:hypothetical protein O4H49_19250 [Kiloniella laminariae]|uniref:Solute-binding protein family 3/N-terminal domain-containing protein n=1 Tax=Kiloniella laminariae TaxID=454162 RepID=A0ABT4LP78_9PROT|nr:hypothetical protein [Kiloniella laminariae]MCZ4282928.1 hypothetical protein [Kiloniella laminariae]
MKRSYLQLLGAFFFLFLFPGRVLAEGEGGCPQVVSSVSNSFLDQTSQKILKSVYDALGCSVTVLAVPGRRGISLFNSMEVDGELHRFDIVEPHYSREFVRSSRPMFYQDGSLWLHPDLQVRETRPTGYLFGVIWQENYMKNHRGKVFNSSEELVKAYQTGEIGSFLYTDFIMMTKITEGEVLPVPQKGGRIIHAPLYHYLGVEFTPFMARFSQYLDQHEPFAVLEDMKVDHKGKAAVVTQ